MAFMSTTHTNTVSARRDEAVAVAVVEDALHLLVDEVEQELDEGLPLVRHADVAPRTTHHRKPMPTTPRTHADQHRVDVDGPEPAVADRLLEEGQVVLDVLRRSEPLPAAIARLHQ